MLYELIAVVRAGNINYVKDVARTTGTYILGNRGTIRSLNNYGTFDLPRPTVKYQTQHHKGHYFTLTFDSSSKVQDEVRRQLGLNPHMIRFSVVKIGDKLGGRRNQTGKIEDVTGKMEWSDRSNVSLFDVSATGEAARAHERITDGILPVSSAGSSQQPMNW